MRTVGRAAGRAELEVAGAVDVVAGTAAAGVRSAVVRGAVVRGAVVPGAAELAVDVRVVLDASERGTKAGREVGAAVVAGVLLRAATGLPALAMPTTTTAQPTTAAQETVADTALPILM